MNLTLSLSARQLAALTTVAAAAGKTPEDYLGARAADLCSAYAADLDAAEVKAVAETWAELKPETQDAVLTEVGTIRAGKGLPVRPDVDAEVVSEL